MLLSYTGYHLCANMNEDNIPVNRYYSYTGRIEKAGARPAFV
jgi:hypothetical protein